MKVDPKWHFIGALTLAGLLSFYSSFIGFMAFAWGGFGRQKFPALEILLFLPPLLAFPLFVIAAGSSRIALFAMWTLAPVHSLALFQMNAGSFAGSFFQYVGLLLACLCDRIAVFLWIAAWLVLFGTRIYGSRGAEPAETIGIVK